MKLILDSNILCQDYWQSSTRFRVLREGLHLVPAELRIPEVVLDEVVNRYREDLVAATEAAERARGALDRLLRSPKLPAGTVIESEAAAAEYREWLVSAIAGVGGEILTYPDVPHRKVVERDLARRSPFKRSGAGYRDFLIWETLRRLTFGGQERIVFVTANTADFGDGPSVGEDLARDVLNPQRIELIQSLEAFNEGFIVPRLAMVEEMRTLLQNKAGTAFDIPRWLQENLIELLRNEEYLETYLLGFPEGVGSVRPNNVVSVDAIGVEEVLELSKDEILVRVKVKAETEFSVDIDWEDYLFHEEVRDFAGPSEPFDSSWTELAEQMTLGFNLVLDNTGIELIDSELGSIAGPSASGEWSSW